MREQSLIGSVRVPLRDELEHIVDLGLELIEERVGQLKRDASFVFDGNTGRVLRIAIEDPVTSNQVDIAVSRMSALASTDEIRRRARVRCARQVMAIEPVDARLGQLDSPCQRHGHSGLIKGLKGAVVADRGRLPGLSQHVALPPPQTLDLERWRRRVCVSR